MEVTNKYEAIVADVEPPSPPVVVAPPIEPIPSIVPPVEVVESPVNNDIPENVDPAPVPTIIPDIVEVDVIITPLVEPVIVSSVENPQPQIVAVDS